MKVLHFGSYYQGEYDIVKIMGESLRSLHDVVTIDTHLYDSQKKDLVDEDFTYSKSPTFSRKYIKSLLLKKLVSEHSPDVVVTNAGGQTFYPDDFKYLQEKGILTIGISLSDPDGFQLQSKYYYQRYNLFCTNSKFALERLYRDSEKILLLPFAINRDFHYPGTQQREGVPKIIVVGECRSERIPFVNMLKSDFERNLVLYGPGWGPIVTGAKYRQALQSGSIYISFSGTGAGYLNPKLGLFEAAACKLALLTEEYAEVKDYFNSSNEILLYNNLSLLKELLYFLTKNPLTIDYYAENAYRRCIKDHTWGQRWKTVFTRLGELYGKE